MLGHDNWLGAFFSTVAGLLQLMSPPRSGHLCWPSLSQLSIQRVSHLPLLGLAVTLPCNILENGLKFLASDNHLRVPFWAIGLLVPPDMQFLCFSSQVVTESFWVFQRFSANLLILSNVKVHWLFKKLFLWHPTLGANITQGSFNVQIEGR